jgi:hypothetical protein
MAWVLVMTGLSSAACEGPRVVRGATSASIQAFLRGKAKKVLTFAGYSGAGYESADAMGDQAAAVLNGEDPATTWINSGATAEGIGAIYGLAKDKGFSTLGIVSSLACEKGVPLSPWVDLVFVVEDTSWGGRLPGSAGLSPTSRAMVDASTAYVAIGGGEIARDEFLAARQAGKTVLFLPAEMDHKSAIDKALKQGKPLPDDFRGAVHQALLASPATPPETPQGQ